MAVFTDLDDRALHRFLASYDLPPLVRYTGIEEGVENSNFLLEFPEEKYVLTLLEARARGEDAPYFSALMCHLADAGIPCPRPLESRPGKGIRTLMEKPALLVNFLEGASKSVFDAEDCRKVGHTLAELHLSASDFEQRRTNQLGPAAWKEIARRMGDKLDKISPGLAGTISVEIAFLEEAWPEELPAGVIHADLFPDNVLWQGDNISGIIDFYFACSDMFAYDLAITLTAWCQAGSTIFDRKKALSMLNGYEELRTLQKTEKLALPTLMRGAAVRFLLSRSHDWLFGAGDALVRPKDPLEYLTILEYHQRQSGEELYAN